MLKVLMVCKANICRSPMARIVAQQCAVEAGIAAGWVVDAAGTHATVVGSAMDERARAALLGRNYLVDKLRSRRIKMSDFSAFDLILAMDHENMAALQHLCPANDQSKLRLLMDFAPAADSREVPDPYFGNAAGFERVLDLCEAAVRGLMASYATGSLPV